MKFAILLVLILTGFTAYNQTGIDTAAVFPIGGIDQYVTIQGKDRSLPLLLFLHGGPGGSVMSYADRFTTRLQEHFLVVQWDQRETGKTLQRNASPVPLSFALFQADTHALIEFLLNRFHRQKLYLAAHSWGTALGFHIARNYPELLYAYLPVGPMINQGESERLSLALMMSDAKRRGNQSELEELSTVRIPFENGEQLYYHRKWLLAYAGSKRQLSKSYVENWASTWLPLFNEASQVNLIDEAPVIRCPVYFFTGRNDLQTNASLTEAYYKRLQAPLKALFWFKYSGHAVPTSEPALMQKLIIEKVLPETFAARKQ